MTKVLELMRFLSTFDPTAVVNVNVGSEFYRDIDLTMSLNISNDRYANLDASVPSWGEKQKKRKR